MAPDVGEEERAIILSLVAELRDLDARLDALEEERAIILSLVAELRDLDARLDALDAAAGGVS